MTKIDVVDYNRELAKECVSLLHDIKITLGPTALRGTLNNHPELKKFLRKHFERDIMRLEREI